MDAEGMLKKEDFSVVKEKIIKTHELLVVFKDKNDKLTKANQAFKNLKTKYEDINIEANRLKIDNERLTFSLDGLKLQCNTNESELLQLKTECSDLNEKYQKTLIDFQLTISKLEESKKNCKCGKTINSSHSKSLNKDAKIKEIQKRCRDLMDKEKYIKTENLALVTKIEELKCINNQMLTDLELSNKKVDRLNNETVYLRQEIQQLKSVKSFQFKDAICFVNDQFAKKTFKKCNRKYELSQFELNMLIQHIKNIKSEGKCDIGMQTEFDLSQFKEENTICDTIFKQDVAVQVSDNVIYSDDEPSYELVQNILHEMRMPKLLSPLHSLDDNPITDFIGPILSPEVNIEQVQRIPNIIVTPPTPSLEKVNVFEMELNKTSENVTTVEHSVTNKKPESNEDNTQEEQKNDKFVFKSNNITTDAVTSRLQMKNQKRVRKYWMPFYSNMFVKNKSKQKHLIKPKKTNPTPLREDNILQTLRTLRENNIVFTISNESLPTIKQTNDSTSVMTTLKPKIVEDIFSEEICCWNRHCLKGNNHIVLQHVSGEMEPQLLGFSNTPFAKKIKVPGIVENQCSRNGNSDNVVEQLLKGLKQLVEQEKVLENRKKKRTKIKSDVPMFFSETETEIERLFYNPSDVLDRNKRLMAAAKLRNLDSTGESIESESDVIVDSGLFTGTPRIDTDMSEGFDFYKNIRGYNNAIQKVNSTPLLNINRDTLTDIQLPIMLSPIASSKGSPEKFALSNLNVSPNNSSNQFFSEPLNGSLISSENIVNEQTETTEMKFNKSAVTEKDQSHHIPSTILEINEPIDGQISSNKSKASNSNYFLSNRKCETLLVRDKAPENNGYKITKIESTVSRENLTRDNLNNFELSSPEHSSTAIAAGSPPSRPPKRKCTLKANSQEINNFQTCKRKKEHCSKNHEIPNGRTKFAEKETIENNTEIDNDNSNKAREVNNLSHKKLNEDIPTLSSNNDAHSSSTANKESSILADKGSKVDTNISQFSTTPNQQKSISLTNKDLFGEDVSDSDDSIALLDVEERTNKKKLGLKNNTLKKKILTKFKSLPYFQNKYNKEIFNKATSSSPRKVKKETGKIKIHQNIILSSARIIEMPTNSRQSPDSNKCESTTITTSNSNNLSPDPHKCELTASTKINKQVDTSNNTPIDILSQVIRDMSKTGPKRHDELKTHFTPVINKPIHLPEEPVLSENINIEKETQDSSEYDINNCPRSPEVLEMSDQLPKLIPTEKPTKLPLTKVKVLMNNLLIYSTEQDMLDEIVNEFAFQDAEYIVQIVLSRLFLDYHDKADDSCPSGPIMTITQRILLGFLSKLEKQSHPGIFNNFLNSSEKDLFGKNTCTLVKIQPVTRMYTAICKLKKDINRIRRFICDGFYFMRDFAIPMLFTVLTMWAEVLPMESESSENITARMIVQLCHLKDCNEPGYNLMPLKGLLNKYFGYPSERWNCDDMFQDILIEYIRNPSRRLSDYTLLIFLKNKPSAWVHQKIKNTLIPLFNQVPESNVNLKATIVILVANICRCFNRYDQKDWSVILEIDNWFERMFNDNSHSILQRSITYARGILPNRPNTRKAKATLKENDVENKQCSELIKETDNTIDDDIDNKIG